MSKKAASLLTYCFFLLVAIITLFWGRQLSAHLQNIRVWNWPAIFFLLIGIPFILIQKESGLPEVWEPRVSNRHRIWIPVVTGLLFAIADLIVIVVLLHPEPYKSLPPFLQPFPYSVALYTAGAFDVEVFFRLIPITIVLFIACRLFKANKQRNIIFGAIAILTALREPIEQWQTGASWFVLYSFITGFAMNLLQAVYYRRAGFLASIMTRLGHYFLWHILYGIYVEYVVLA